VFETNCDYDETWQVKNCSHRKYCWRQYRAYLRSRKEVDCEINGLYWQYEKEAKK